MTNTSDRFVTMISGGCPLRRSALRSRLGTTEPGKRWIELGNVVVRRCPVHCGGCCCMIGVIVQDIANLTELLVASLHLPTQCVLCPLFFLLLEKTDKTKNFIKIYIDVLTEVKLVLLIDQSINEANDFFLPILVLGVRNFSASQGAIWTYTPGEQPSLGPLRRRVL